jgi:hypothetical protein
MLRRWHVLLLILVTLTAFCGLAAAKLRATPKYDCIEIGTTTTYPELLDRIPANWWEPSTILATGDYVSVFCCDEGRIEVVCRPKADNCVVIVEKKITRRGPLERLALLAGWR